MKYRGNLAGWVGTLQKVKCVYVCCRECDRRDQIAVNAAQTRFRVWRLLRIFIDCAVCGGSNLSCKGNRFFGGGYVSAVTILHSLKSLLKHTPKAWTEHSPEKSAPQSQWFAPCQEIFTVVKIAFDQISVHTKPTLCCKGHFGMHSLWLLSLNINPCHCGFTGDEAGR